MSKKAKGLVWRSIHQNMPIDYFQMSDDEIINIANEQLAFIIEDTQERVSFQEMTFILGCEIADNVLLPKVANYKSYWNWVWKNHLKKVRLVLSNQTTPHAKDWDYDSLPKSIKRILENQNTETV